jgi:hypothetical protein
LNNSHEAFHEGVKHVYQYFVNELEIPPKHILLLSESANIDGVVIKVASRYGKDTIRVKWVRMFENSVSFINEYLNSDLDTLEFKQYDKKFLNLNRRWRIHRPIFVALLKSYGLLDNGYVSLAEVEGYNWSNHWIFLDSYKIYIPEIYDILNRNKASIENLGNLYLDTEDLHINQVAVNNNLDFYYCNTYFSVVSETNYFKTDNDSIFLSEKIFKPVLKKHPFIILSRPNTLEKFRSLGYKSFHPFIKEDYDYEQDDQTRLLMIVEEVQRLSNLTDDELKYYLTGVREIVKYNYDVLSNKRNNRYTSFITPLI